MPPHGLGLMLTSCSLVACLPVATSAAIPSGCRPKASLKAGELAVLHHRRLEVNLMSAWSRASSIAQGDLSLSGSLLTANYRHHQLGVRRGVQRRVCLGVKDPRATIRRGMVDLARGQVGLVEVVSINAGRNAGPRWTSGETPGCLKGVPWVLAVRRYAEEETTIIIVTFRLCFSEGHHRALGGA